MYNNLDGWFILKIYSLRNQSMLDFFSPVRLTKWPQLADSLTMGCFCIKSFAVIKFNLWWYRYLRNRGDVTPEITTWIILLVNGLMRITSSTMDDMLCVIRDCKHHARIMFWLHKLGLMILVTFQLHGISLWITVYVGLWIFNRAWI